MGLSGSVRSYRSQSDGLGSRCGCWLHQPLHLDQGCALIQYRPKVLYLMGQEVGWEEYISISHTIRWTTLGVGQALLILALSSMHQLENARNMSAFACSYSVFEITPCFWARSKSRSSWPIVRLCVVVWFISDRFSRGRTPSSARIGSIPGPEAIAIASSSFTSPENNA